MIFHPSLTVLMPVYNEEKNVEHAIRVISQKCDELSCSYEILIVDDASTDQTVQRVKGLILSNGRIRLVEHSINQGVGGSIVMGLKHSLGEFVIFIPADLAMDMKYLKEYLEASKTADIVVGLRSDRRDYSVMRKIISLINITLIKVLFRMPQEQFNHICLYRRKIFEGIEVKSHSAFFAAEIMIKARDLGYILKEIKVGYTPRKYGKSVAARPKWVIRAVQDLFRFWAEWVKQ